MSPRDGLVPRGGCFSVEANVLAAEVRAVIGRARSWIVGKYTDCGTWAASTTVRPSLLSRFVLARRFSESFLDGEAESASAVLLAAQLPDGGWADGVQADGGSTADLNTSVETYLALKIATSRGARTSAWASVTPDFVTSRATSGSLNEPLRAAVMCIQQLGGADACTGETRLLLALFGQIPFADVPSARALRRGEPEAKESSQTVLGLLRRSRASISLSPEEGIRELIVSVPRRRSLAALAGLRRWISGCARRRKSPRGTSALRRVLRSVPKTQGAEQGGTEQGNALAVGPTAAELFRVAFLLHAIDRSEGPAWRRCWKALSRLSVEDESGDGFFFRRGGSELRETADALRVLGEAGLTTRHPALLEAAEWLVSRAERWDVSDDETRLAVLCALKAQFNPRSDALPPTAFIVDEETAEQSRADRSRRLESFLEDATPLIAAHLERFFKTAKIRRWNAARSGRVLEQLGQLGVPRTAPFALRLIRRLTRIQNLDGSFGDLPGRGSIETTARVIAGLRSVGVETDDPVVARAFYWLRLWQEERGAWRSPDNATTARSELNVTATATALSAILSCASESEYESLHRGIDFLLESQRPDGAWGTTPDAPPDIAATYAALGTLSRYAVFAASLSKDEAPPALRVVRAEEDEEEATPHLSIAR